MLTGFSARVGRSIVAAARYGFAVLALLCVLMPAVASAADRAQIFVTKEDGYGRLILSFPDRLDLPAYQLKLENSVLVLTFDDPISLQLPDLASILPDYISIGRVDPDGRGVRFGLRTTLKFNRMDAGEKLFIDLMPPEWQGMPPALPPEVVAELTQRSMDASILAEQRRKAELAKTLHPNALVRVGRNPTFTRVLFQWTVDAEARFSFEGDTATIDFDWPVPIDLYQIKSNLPPELISVDNAVTPNGSQVSFKVAEGVVPRFYEITGQQFIIDVDSVLPEADSVSAEALVEAHEAATAAEHQDAVPDGVAEAAADPLQADVSAMVAATANTETVPYVTSVGSTVRVVFPFEQDTPAAVFRRGDTLWLLFDTLSAITAPLASDDLASIASAFTIAPAGETQVVRIDLTRQGLATLGSEGRSWVLSLGDTLLMPTEPLALNRRRDADGLFQITADLDKPARVHQFRDPIVGDVLTVVTAYPPARGAPRTFEFVDFTALPSVHGLVIKAGHDDVDVALDQRLAVITAPGGLTVSALEQKRTPGVGMNDASRDGFIDLASNLRDDPVQFVADSDGLMADAARSEGAVREKARLDLAKLYLANQFAYEAVGVLEVLGTDLKSEDLKLDVRLTLAAANVVANRSKDALSLLNSPELLDETDALMWRTMAKADAYDFQGARVDAMASEGVVDAYPNWVRSRFYLSAVRAAIEAGDASLAARYFKAIDFAKLSVEDASLFQLLTGRLAELEGRTQEAIDDYGQVIASDIRPTRAEAVYRTLLLLDREGRIDLDKATATLSAESLLWRGNPLEADMQKLLAELYFRHGDYRQGFETVKQAVQFYPDSKPVNELAGQAQTVFSDLYLNGTADKLSPVDALSLYYDFRQLTPPGARGDEMIRNLVKRLVKVDLLAQAAELLQYQIDNRLKGAAQAQVAADLAVIEIADRQPEAALRALNATRQAGLSPTLERQRRILEARALIDAGRDELALDLLTSVEGRDADILRIDAHWKSKRYGQAAEGIEVMYSANGIPLDSEHARMDIVKAAVGFVLSNDSIGLSRLRSKFGERMAQSAEWPMFDYVTSQIETQSVEFKKVAREISGLDSLDAFLGAYRELYGGDEALTPEAATKPDATG